MGGEAPPNGTLKSTQIYLPPPADSNIVSLIMPHTAYTQNREREREREIPIRQFIVLITKLFLLRL